MPSVADWRRHRVMGLAPSKTNTYSSVLLEAGERHVCVNLDSALPQKSVETCALHSQKLGKVYYFRWRYSSGGDLLFAPVDSDEAKYQIAQFPAHSLNPKKWLVQIPRRMTAYPSSSHHTPPTARHQPYNPPHEQT